MDSTKVVAYITAYRDGVALHRCIQAIRNQDYPVHQIVVVDNSPVPLIQADALAEEAALLVWSFPENIGISGGVSLAIEWAVCQSYDFIWMFDQDSEPDISCLSSLIAAYNRLAIEKGPIGIVAPVSIDVQTQYAVPPAVFMKDRFVGTEPCPDLAECPCDSPITSGTLLCLKTVSVVSVPDVRLFIDGIDWDYGLRLSRAGYQNFVILAAKMRHTFGYPMEVRFMGKRKIFHPYSALRFFYICRNHTYLELRFSQGRYKVTCVLRRLKFLCSQVFWLCVAKTGNKRQKIWACFIGTYYGLIGNLDRSFAADV